MKTTISLSIATMMLAGIAAVPANADVVTFTTTGAFACGTILTGCSTSPTTKITVTGGGNTSSLTYTGNPGTTVQPVPPPQQINFGVIAVSSLNDNTAESFANSTFLLTVNQTSPAILSDNLSATIAGTLEFFQSKVVIDFANNGVLTLGNEIYSIANNGVVNIGSVSPTTITGQVDAFSGSGGTTPEPSFLGLTGLGFVGLTVMALRRRRQRGIAA